MKLYPLLFILSLSITPVFAGEIHDAITGINDNNEREKVAALIKQDRQLVHAKNTKGDQPMHIATQQDDCQMMRLLIDAGTDVNAKRAKGWTLLRFVGAGDSKDVCLILLEKGANRNAPLTSL
jgi:ankyrin repeat protein